MARAKDDLAAALASDDGPKELFSEIAKVREKVEDLREYLRIKYKQGVMSRSSVG